MLSKSPPHILEEYKARINRVMDYIENHLADEITLKELADVANFSSFHFPRIFNAMVGETLFQFIQRLRMEKSAYLLVMFPKLSVLDVAVQCGFTNTSAFSRCFRTYFQMTPTQWKNKYQKTESNISTNDRIFNQTIRNLSTSLRPTNSYPCSENQINQKRITMKTKPRVEVKEFTDMTVAYVRHIGPYKGNAALFEGLFGKLMGWAGPRRLLENPDAKTLIIYHDNPEITKEDQLRISVCLTVPPETKTDGEIGKMTIPGGNYALCHFELETHEYQQAWDWVFSEWLPSSGYQADDRPCFELYGKESVANPALHKVAITIPIKPL